MHLGVRSAIFLALAVFGYVALWGFASKNGTFALMRLWSSHNRLPETGEKYATEFTRWRWLDEFLRSLLTLFWPMVNGTHPGSSLMCFYFAGQGIVAWILTALEGQRILNKDKLRVVSFTTIYGLLFQGLGIGVVGPLFLCFSPLGDDQKFPVSIYHTRDVDAIIPATIGGIIIPTILMSLHAPTVISLDQKIDLVRLWQFFPLLFCLGHRIWARFLSRWLASYSVGGTGRKMQRKALRRVYSFGLLCAAIPHIIIMSIPLIDLEFPSFFAGKISIGYHLRAMFVPISPFSGAKAESIGEGASWFLQWDMILMFCTYLVWAYFADLRMKYPHSGVFSPYLIIRLLGWSLLVGPMGAALLAFWERDEIVYEATEHTFECAKRPALRSGFSGEAEYWDSVYREADYRKAESREG